MKERKIIKRTNTKSGFSPFTFHFSLHKGFTLIELLISLAIIGTVTSFIMVNLLSARERGRDAERKSELQQLRTALELYRNDQGVYPTAPLPACNAALAVSGTTYIQKVPCDPTNSGQYVYTYLNPTTSTYTLVTCLENENDKQKDTTNNATYCTGTTNWSFTLNNP